MRREWAGLFGIAAGGITLFLIGQFQDPAWVSEFLAAGSRKLGENFGTNPNLWGPTNMLCNKDIMCVTAVGGITTIICLALVINFLWWHREGRPFYAAEIAVPAGLLIAPYVWTYDHLLLALPIVAIALRVMETRKSFLFAASIPLLFSILALLLLAFAASSGLDIWSALLPCATIVASFLTIRRRPWPLLSS
jgi:hypothetical protein